MNDIVIPSDWLKYVSYSFNRIYINPASGCSANCAYCYIFDEGHPRRPHLFDVTANDVRKWLLTQKGFRAGMSGTLISLSPCCDPFADGVIDKTLELVEALASLQNPMQLSTKYYVDKIAAKRIGESQSISGQLVLYATITSFELWKRIEPSACEPYTRLNGLQNAQREDIITCLAIKPVLPDITDNEIHLFVQAIKDYNIPYCVAGVMYSNGGIEKRFERRKLLNEEFKHRLNIKGDRPSPHSTNHEKYFSLNIDTLDIITKIIPQLQLSGAQCMISGPCVVASSYNILCPTGIWRYLPHLCVNCSVDCQSKFAHSSNEIKAIFPNEVEDLRVIAANDNK